MVTTKIEADTEHKEAVNHDSFHPIFTAPNKYKLEYAEMQGANYLRYNKISLFVDIKSWRTCDY